MTAIALPHGSIQRRQKENHVQDDFIFNSCQVGGRDLHEQPEHGRGGGGLGERQRPHVHVRDRERGARERKDAAILLLVGPPGEPLRARGGRGRRR